MRVRDVTNTFDSTKTLFIINSSLEINFDHEWEIKEQTEFDSKVPNVSLRRWNFELFTLSFPEQKV